MKRRDYKRFVINATASLFIDEDTERSLILQDLSARGASIICDSPLEINKRVKIIIKASFLFDKPVCRQAKVVWCQKIDKNLWQAGLDFGLDNKISLD